MEEARRKAEAEERAIEEARRKAEVDAEMKMLRAQLERAREVPPPNPTLTFQSTSQNPHASPDGDI